MRPFAISALLLATACGGSPDRARAPTAPPTALAPATPTAPQPTAPAPTRVGGLTLAENQRFGRLLSIEVVDDEVCFVTVLIPGRDGGSIFDGAPGLCQEDHGSELDQDVIISLDGDLDVLHIVPLSEYQRQDLGGSPSSDDEE